MGPDSVRNFALLCIGCLLLFTNVSLAQPYQLRPIDELNTQGIGEAYPWLSDDGLRLYYCGNNNRYGLTEIYMSRRDPVTGYFGSPEKLQVNIFGYDNLSPYISHDETQIVYVVRKKKDRMDTQIFIARRAQKDLPFEQPQALDIVGDIRGELLSPSMTPDGGQLYAFNFHRNQQRLVRFDRQPDGSYAFTHQTSVNNPYILKTGKLSGDGLEYYLSVDRRRGLPSIYILTRQSIHDDFGEWQMYRDDIINAFQFRNHQPFFTAGKEHVVFTRSSRDRWERNNMYIATRSDFVTRDAQDFNLQDLSVYPNPFWEDLYIKNDGEEIIVDVEIYDVSSRLVYRREDIIMAHPLDLHTLDSGLYILHIVDPLTHERKVFKIEKIRQ